ncbi:g-protein coupled receptor GRL101 [Trichonephila inaurata madagascariensis]|uniref:G-protein coupled receptor GRL101 n=1 Tax=Trichonephila inaurata madagascariensis TaxID=2747483 RepID=A0A8X6YCV2_9ARAC|nr:g-protein coupled receptor GRL101 [Trichonephila inaurata madagascariensis]
MSLADGDLAFEGLENRLEELRATNAHYFTQWDWSQLRYHRRLNLIDINLIEMYSLEQKFPPLESLNMLGISKAAISFIHPKAFAGLVNLKILHLRDNSIDKMRRSMFPSVAKELEIIDLSGNLLTSLPDDMFHRMPKLKEVELNRNKFVTLNEETFSWAFQHLQTMMFIGNDLRCDCRMKWIVDIKKPLYFKGTCAMPENLNGVRLTYLTHKKLRC